MSQSMTQLAVHNDGHGNCPTTMNPMHPQGKVGKVHPISSNDECERVQSLSQRNSTPIRARESHEFTFSTAPFGFNLSNEARCGNPKSSRTSSLAASVVRPYLANYRPRLIMAQSCGPSAKGIWAATTSESLTDKTFYVPSGSWHSRIG